MTSPRQVSNQSDIRPTTLLAGTIAVLYLAREVLIPFAIALTLTFLLTPVVAALQKLRIPRVASVILVLLSFLGSAGGLTWVLAGQLINVANELPLYRENIRRKIQSIKRPSSQGSLGRAAESVKQIGQEISRAPALGDDPPARAPKAGQVQIVTPAPGAVQQFRDLITPLIGPLGIGGVVLIFTVFMLIEKEDLRNRLLRLGGISRLNDMTKALDDAAQRVSRYLLMQLLVNAGFGLLFGIGLHFIGVPSAALWGATAAIFRIVPYVGTTVAAAAPLALSLAVFDGWLPPLLVFLLVASLELLIANVLEPWLYGSHTGISPLALLVTTVFWTVLWGPAGLILSTPLTVCAVVVGRYVPQFRFLHILLGDEPVLGPHAQIYQRLLAMDQQEAREVLDLALKDRPLVDLYDSVLVPALSMAEQDRHKCRLDASREEFLFLNINEIVAEMNDAGTAIGPAAALSFSGRLLCFPASDEADCVTASMLAQLLEQAGHSAISFPVGASVRDLEILSPDPNDMIIVSALPPYALSQSVALYKQLRQHFPKVRTMVGLWGFTGDVEKLKLRFDRSQPELIATTMAEAVKQIGELAGAAKPLPDAQTRSATLPPVTAS